MAAYVKPAPAALPKTLVLGANPIGTLFYAMGVGFSKVVSDHTQMKVDLFPQGATVWWPMFETGEVHFGINVPDDVIAAYLGTEIYKEPTKGKGYPIRTIMLGTPIQVVFFVPGDSDIKRITDIKGKRIPTEYGAFFTSTLSCRALLANAGLTFADVKGLSVPSVEAGIKAIIEGRADCALMAVGGAIVEELKAAKGARGISIDSSPDAVKRMQKVFAGYYAIKVSPGPPGITEEIWGLGKDITLWAYEKLREDIVYEITKAIWENYKELGPIHPRLKLWTPDRFASTRAIIPFHTGAIKLYKEKGVWTKELEEHQTKLLTIKK
jgi:TRAP transporter TAXI family solute receptor